MVEQDTKTCANAKQKDGIAWEGVRDSEKERAKNIFIFISCVLYVRLTEICFVCNILHAVCVRDGREAAYRICFFRKYYMQIAYFLVRVVSAFSLFVSVFLAICANEKSQRAQMGS